MLMYQTIFRIVSLGILLQMISGCSWTPTVETSIHEGPHGTVSLITSSEESFKGNHPVTLQVETIAQVLRGLQVQRSKRLIQKIFSGEATAKPIFNEEQINYFTTPLQTAFSQVTAEEHITFQTHANPGTGVRAVKGSMYVLADDLYVTLAFLGQGPHTATKSTGKGALNDQEGRGKPQIAFSPVEVLQKKEKSHWLLGGTENNFIVINLTLLASLKQQGTPILQIEAEDSPPTSTAIPILKNTIPSNGDDGTSKELLPQSQPPRLIPQNTDSKKLVEEIKELRKELAEQRKAIERLNKKERETQ